MDIELVFNLTPLLFLLGLSTWMSLAVYNNIVDRQTNVTLLHRMISMELLKTDPDLGNGLAGRAIENRTVAAHMLTAVVSVQILIIFCMWSGSIAYLLGVFEIAGVTLGAGVALASLGIGSFAALWFFFLCGGLYFGYWIKMPQVQQVHLTLLMISILTLILLRG